MVDRERRNAALLGDGIAFFVCAAFSGASFALDAHAGAPVAVAFGVLFALLAVVCICRWWYDLHR